MEKTVNDIQNWFDEEIKIQLDVIPDRIKETAKGNKEYTKIIAESIARKCCFRVAAVQKSLSYLLK